MRTLILLRGAPGCGKSTWIKNTFPKESGIVALSADDIRLMIQAPEMNVVGNKSISQKNDTIVWKILFEILEERLKNGETTVIDATNSKTSEMSRYKKLADLYRYRTYVVDFTDIDIDVVKQRNANRNPAWKRVPEFVIDNQYSRFNTQGIPSGIIKIKPDEISKVFPKVFNFNKFKKIYFIGDIHGCYSALKAFMDKHYSDDCAYIFTGDYLDRGLENAKTLEYLISIAYKKSNVLLLEGNHECHLRNWANGEVSKSRQFEYHTKKDLESSGLDKKLIRDFCRSFGQYAWFEFRGKEFFACHGGIPTIKDIPYGYMNTNQLIKGVGDYPFVKMVADNFYNEVKGKHVYQIFGHRNPDNLPIKLNDNVYCLEGQVEHGGHLRIVEVDENGVIKTHEVKNYVFKSKQMKTIEKNEYSVKEFVDFARSSNGDIIEKSFGNISSFNFSRNVFCKQKWNSMNVQARGLYIDTVDNKIVARSYNKFFNLNEREETEVTSLKRNLVYPVKAYIKENGFLGLVSYYNDEFFITSKSSYTGDYAQVYFKKLFDEQFQIGSEQRDSLKALLSKNKTAVFEVIDIENDPHIIEYDKSNIVLLDVIDNELKQFNVMSYKKLVNFANEIKCKVKQIYKTIHNNDELLELIDSVNQYEFKVDGKYVEGFVLSDANGFQFKLKTDYYNTWKSLRKIANEVVSKGYSDHTSSLLTPMANYFYKFVKDLIGSEVNKESRKKKYCNLSIIQLRNMFIEKGC